MSKDTESLSPNPLFARKGEAAPAPAVGYVGVTDLRGKLDRRQAQRPYDGGERRHSVLDDIAAGVVAPATAKPVPAPRPTPRAAPAATGAEGSLAKLIHRRGGPRQKAPAARRASKPPAPASPARAQAKTAKPGPKRKRPRRQLTVRLPVEQFARFNALAKQSGYTYQDILATATSLYLEQTADEGKKKGRAKRAKAGRRRAKSKR